jgi:hypothetical protein
MTRLILAGWLTAVAVCCSSTAIAAPFMLDSGIEPPGAGLGLLSQSPYYIYDSYIAASPFRLTERARVRAVQWTGYHSHSNRPDPSFVLEFYAATNSGPGRSLERFYFSHGELPTIVDTGFKVTYATVERPVFDYRARIAPLRLEAGDYYMSIYSFAEQTRVGSWFWISEYTGPFGPSAHMALYESNPKWWPTSQTADYSISGTVPEPASLSLLGVAAWGVVRRRRSQRSLRP